MSSKQDRQGARTVAALEQKYKFGKTFEEMIEAAEGAQKTASNAQKSADDVRLSVDKLDNSLDQEEVFRRLTDNGRIQGVYMEDGEIYINASYITSLEKLFAKDINMSGKFKSETMAFIEPGLPELEQLNRYILQLETPTTTDIARYDFNNNGKLDIGDLSLLNFAYSGQRSLSSWSGAVKTKVAIEIDMSNPSKAIKVYGTNMWDRDVEHCFGVQDNGLLLSGGVMCGSINMNGNKITELSPEIADAGDSVCKGYLDKLIKSDDGDVLCRVLSDGVKEYFNPPMDAGVEYRTVERWGGQPVYVKRISFGNLPNNTSASVATGIDTTKMISIEGFLITGAGYHYGFPYISTSGQPVAWFRTGTGTNNLIVQTATDMSKSTAEFVIKYTK